MQPPDYDDDRPPPPYRDEPPRTSIPKTIGILNIVFGALLMLCSVCVGLNLAVQSSMGPALAGQQQQFQQMMEAERQKQLQDLKNREQAAKDEKEKADIQAQEKTLRAQPLPKMPDMSKLAETEGLRTYGIADVVSGLILNVLMIVSGIGLVAYKEWGRKLGLWVALLKIVRLIAVYGFFLLVVVPGLTRAFSSMFQEMADQMAKAAPPGQPAPKAAELAQVGTTVGIVYAAFAVAMIVLGAIYPIIVLILLSRARVRAACAPAAPAPETLQE